MPTEKTVKVGVRAGGGDPNCPYLWDALYLTVARDESMEFLNESQYHHAADQVKDLATHQDPTHSDSVDVTKIEDFYELSDKGGPLGKINLRVFFAVYKRPTPHIIVFGAIKKENEGKTPMTTVVRIRRRKRGYEESLKGK